jgi:hypothetical protein
MHRKSDLVRLPASHHAPLPMMIDSIGTESWFANRLNGSFATQSGAKLTSTYRRGTMKSLQHGAFAMPLQRGEVQGYDFNRMVVEFTMLNQGNVILCAISSAAMDGLEGRRDVMARSARRSVYAAAGSN